MRLPTPPTHGCLLASVAARFRPTPQGRRFRRRQEAPRQSAPRIRHRAALGLERPAHRAADPRHHARPGRPEGQAGLRASAAGPDDALPVRRLVPPLEGGARRGREARHERVDLRRELLPERASPAAGCRSSCPNRAGMGLSLKEVKDRAQVGRQHVVSVLPPRRRQGGERHRRRSKQAKRCPRAATSSATHRARRQFPVARQPLLREPAHPRRHREVPRSHAGGLQARDRRPVRQAGSRRVHRRTEHPPRRRFPVVPRSARAIPEALGLQPARPPAQPDAAKSATGASVRHNYFCHLNDLFIERWAKPYLRVVRPERARVHRPLLGPRVAALRRRAGQHGHGGLAAPARASTR